jgi:hypothetical protein
MINLVYFSFRQEKSYGIYERWYEGTLYTYVCLYLRVRLRNNEFKINVNKLKVLAGWQLCHKSRCVLKHVPVLTVRQSCGRGSVYMKRIESGEE